MGVFPELNVNAEVEKCLWYFHRNSRNRNFESYVNQFVSNMVHLYYDVGIHLGSSNDFVVKVRGAQCGNDQDIRSAQCT